MTTDNYNTFRKQAHIDRTDANKKLQTLRAVSDLSDEQVQKIAEDMYCMGEVKVVTLEDGTKAFGASNRFGIITKDGVFSVLKQTFGVSIQHGDLINGKVKNHQWLENENLSKYAENISKFPPVR